MKILALDKISPTATPEKIGPLLKEEAQHGYQLYKDGIFREMYFRQDQPGAVLIMECTDIAEARDVLADLPLVKADLIDFELIPLGAFPFENAFAE